MKKLLFFLVVIAIVGCTQPPTGQVPEEPVEPVDIGDIVKEALPPAQETEEPTTPPKSDIFARITVDEGELVKLDLEATDPDGDPIEYSFSSPLDENGEWQTQDGDAGEHEVTITATDGELETVKKILIVVKATNKPPRLVPPGDITVTERQLVELSISARDPNNDPLTWKYSKPFDATGKWQTQIGDKGKYQVTVEVSDGEFSDSATFFVTVLPGNQPPTIEIDTEITLMEGETVVLEPEVVDPDGDEVEVKYSGWMNSDTYKTTMDDQGLHKVTITASDGQLEESVVVRITVENVNRPPEIHGLIVK